MSRPTPTTHATRTARTTVLLAAAGVLLFLAAPAGAAADTHTICHATESDTNPYEMITIAKSAVYNAHLGSDHQNGEDIIPPFTYNDQVHSQNYDAEGQAIFENDCVVPGSETSTSTSETSSTSDTTTTSDTNTTTTQIPVFGSVTALALGVGGALGGTLLMLRRRL